MYQTTQGTNTPFLAQATGGGARDSQLLAASMAASTTVMGHEVENRLHLLIIGLFNFINGLFFIIFDISITAFLAIDFIQAFVGVSFCSFLLDRHKG